MDQPVQPQPHQPGSTAVYEGHFLLMRKLLGLDCMEHFDDYVAWFKNTLVGGKATVFWQKEPLRFAPADSPHILAMLLDKKRKVPGFEKEQEEDESYCACTRDPSSITGLKPPKAGPRALLPLLLTGHVSPLVLQMLSSSMLKGSDRDRSVTLRIPVWVDDCSAKEEKTKKQSTEEESQCTGNSDNDPLQEKEVEEEKDDHLTYVDHELNVVDVTGMRVMLNLMSGNICWGPNGTQMKIFMPTLDLFELADMLVVTKLGFVRLAHDNIRSAVELIQTAMKKPITELLAPGGYRGPKELQQVLHPLHVKDRVKKGLVMVMITKQQQRERGGDKNPVPLIEHAMSLLELDYLHADVHNILANALGARFKRACVCVGGRAYTAIDAFMYIQCGQAFELQRNILIQQGQIQLPTGVQGGAPPPTLTSSSNVTDLVDFEFDWATSSTKPIARRPAHGPATTQSSTPSAAPSQSSSLDSIDPHKSPIPTGAVALRPAFHFTDTEDAHYLRYHRQPLRRGDGQFGLRMCTACAFTALALELLREWLIK